MTPVYTSSRTPETGTATNLARKRYNIPTYAEQLAALPPPGTGSGYHDKSFSVAKAGAYDGISPDVVYQDLRRIADSGARSVPHREIETTIRNAYREVQNRQVLKLHGITPPAKPKPRIKNGTDARQRIIDRGKAIVGKLKPSQWLLSHSPVEIPADPREQCKLFLRKMFYRWPGAFICMGTGKKIPGTLEIEAGDRCTLRTWPQWCYWIDAGGPIPEHISVNTFTGRKAPKKSNPDELSRRCDNSTAALLYTLVEYEAKDVPTIDQARFWIAAPLPVAALVFSGRGSIHAWLRMNCRSHQEWMQTVENGIYKQRLEPMGVDPNDKNPSRFARPPGARHSKNNRIARLLYLDPNAALERGKR